MTERGTARRGFVLRGLLLAVVVTVVYAPAFRAGFIWDDGAYVTENRLLREPDGLQRIWTAPRESPQWYPLVFTTFWVDNRLWGLDPAGYHAVNVALHVGVAVLLLAALERLRVPGAALAALLFAVHPLQVESVAWVTERKNVLSLLFFMLALHAWWRWRPPDDDGDPAGGRAAGWWLALGWFLLALLSKTATVPFPAVLLVLIWWKRGRLGWPDVRATLPFFAMAIGFGLVTSVLEGELTTRGAHWTLSPVERCLVAGRALWFYAAKLVWPHPVSFNYPHWDVDAGVLWHYVFPLGAVAVVTALWSARGRIGRGPLAAVLLFAGTLAPVLGFVNVYYHRYSYTADHFAYLPSMALLALLSATLVQGWRYWLPARDREGRIVAGALACTFGLLAFAHATKFRDLDTLWADTLAKNPRSCLAHNSVGHLLRTRARETGDPALADAAIAHFRAAVAGDAPCEEAHNNLGASLLERGEIEEGDRHLQRALAIRPDLLSALDNHALVMQGLGRGDEAIAAWQRAIAAQPDYIPVRWNLAHHLAALGDRRGALVHVAAAIATRPDAANLRLFASELLAADGRHEEALRHLAVVLAARPDDPDANARAAASRQALGRAGATTPATP
jgi:tetratricopeptide (TPR) repeat protein